MKNIVCVLKTGGWNNRNMRVEYKPEHVQWLARMVKRHVHIDHRFVCLSDVAVDGVETIPLRDELPGWWSKMCLFREFDQAFYLDLDTVITGNIDHMVSHSHDFTVLRNFSSTDKSRIGSGLMAWGRDLSGLYNEFMRDPQRHMRECVTSEMWGDQGFIQAHYAGHMDRFQDLFPGQVVSFKTDLHRGDPRRDNRIVCFHGKPKPQDVNKRWVPK